MSKLFIKKVTRVTRRNVFGEVLNTESRYYICRRRFKLFGVDFPLPFPHVETEYLNAPSNWHSRFLNGGEVYCNWMPSNDNCRFFLENEVKNIMTMIEQHPSRFVLSQ